MAVRKFPTMTAGSEPEPASKPAWSARCDCYRGGPGHSPNSGRCGYRGEAGERGVTDPTHNEGQTAICQECREGHKD
jgi:hypothetical protein